MKLCSVCLCKNRNLQPLGNLQETFDVIVQRSNSKPEVVLCFECRHLLKKYRDFRRKAELAQGMITAHNLDSPSKFLCSDEAVDEISPFSSLAVTYKDTFDYIFSEETSEDEDGYGHQPSESFDKTTDHSTNIQPSTTNIRIKQEIEDSEEECSLKQLRDRKCLQAKVDKPVAVTNYHINNIQPSTSNIRIKEELVDYEEKSSIKEEMVDLEEETSIKEELVEEESDISKLSGSNPMQVQLGVGCKKLVVVDKDKPPPLRQLAPLRVFSSSASSAKEIIVLSATKQGILQLPVEKTQIEMLPRVNNQSFHLKSIHPERFHYAEKNMNVFPWQHCDNSFPFHSMMENNTDDSQEDLQRRILLNDSSDEAKVEDRKRRNREKYKRYREKKKKMITVLPPTDIDEKKLEERRRKHRENSRRYREKKKKEMEVAALSMVAADSSSDSSDKRMKEARQKQLNAEKCKRYRDKKRKAKQNAQKYMYLIPGVDSNNSC